MPPPTEEIVGGVFSEGRPGPQEIGTPIDAQLEIDPGRAAAPPRLLRWGKGQKQSTDMTYKNTPPP